MEGRMMKLKKRIQGNFSEIPTIAQNGFDESGELRQLLAIN